MRAPARYAPRVTHTNRRDFLVGAAGLGALTFLPDSTSAHALGTLADEKPSEPPKPLPFKISLAQWSLHRALFEKRLDNRDFAKTAKQDYHVEAIEYVNSFFKDKVADASYVRDLKARADDLGVRTLLVMCDGEGDLGHADAAERMKAVENHKKWIEAVKVLGGHSIRVNAAGSGSREEHAMQAAEGLHNLALAADPFGIDVIVENHGGLSSDGAWLAGVIKAADHPRVGTLPDFGNFTLGEGKTYDRYKGVTELMPFAKAVSAKSHDFDERGEETSTDYERMLKIVVKAGYRGHVGIEYEGSRLSEPEGILATKKLLERVRAALG